MAIQFIGQFGGSLRIGSTALYPFTSFTFTTVGASGSLGPSGSAILSSYTGSSSGSYFSNPTFFTTGSFQGYQIWTVPETATYEIETAGARGGTAPAFSGSLTWGNGAIIRARVPLTQGQKIMMVVGQFTDALGVNVNQYATYQGFGGGGGSFVTISGSLATPVLIAGGGGGSGRYSAYLASTFTGRSGSTSTSGSASVRGATGGSGSLGGRSHINSASVVSGNGYDGGGGGGFLGNGQNGDGTYTRPFIGGTYGEGGNAFVSGSKGGNASTSWGAPSSYAGSWGGFGGGGSGNGIIVGGGGGGYSGGGGAWGNSSPQSDGGGGGGSYIISTATSVATSDGNYDGLNTFSGSSITNLNSYNSGSGYIRITKL
jgi:hypothetical protein